VSIILIKYQKQYSITKPYNCKGEETILWLKVKQYLKG